MRRYTQTKSKQADNHAQWCAQAEQEVYARMEGCNGKIDWDTLSYMGKYLHLSPVDAAVRYCERLNR